MRGQPRNPNPDGKGPPEVFAEVLGGLKRKADEIVCLRPIDSLDTRPKRNERQFRLALRGADLPKLISLDWSYGGAIQLANILRQQNPNWRHSDVFVEVAHRWGSFSSYDAIPASALRVQTWASSPNNPATWPPLINAAVANVAVTDPGTVTIP